MQDFYLLENSTSSVHCCTTQIFVFRSKSTATFILNAATETVAFAVNVKLA